MFVVWWGRKLLSFLFSMCGQISKSVFILKTRESVEIFMSPPPNYVHFDPQKMQDHVVLVLRSAAAEDNMAPEGGELSKSASVAAVRNSSFLFRGMVAVLQGSTSAASADRALSLLMAPLCHVNWNETPVPNQAKRVLLEIGARASKSVIKKEMVRASKAEPRGDQLIFALTSGVSGDEETANFAAALLEQYASRIGLLSKRGHSVCIFFAFEYFLLFVGIFGEFRDLILVQ